ncbi:MAG: hypothetical protein ABJA20_13305 [Novosphingobium sp.]
MLRNTLIVGLLVASSAPALAAPHGPAKANASATVAAPAATPAVAEPAPAPAAAPAATTTADATASAPAATAPTATAPEATTAASATAYTTTETKLGTLLDDPAAKAIVDKYIPGLSASPQIDMARGMTLKQIQALAPTSVKDEQLAQVQTELAKLSAHG